MAKTEIAKLKDEISELKKRVSDNESRLKRAHKTMTNERRIVAGQIDTLHEMNADLFPRVVQLERDLLKVLKGKKLITH